MGNSYTPKQVADLLGVTAMSVRRYADRFGVSFLTAGASPPKGQPRTFTDADVYKLRLIHQWTSEGKSYDECEELLRTLPPLDDAPLVQVPAGADAQPVEIPEGLAILQRVGDALGMVAAQDERIGSLTTITDRHTQEIARVTAELTALKERRDRRTAFAVAALPWLVLAVLGLVVVVLLLVFMRPG
jgi:DNA-binding transcriptional MerR regulator